MELGSSGAVGREDSADLRLPSRLVAEMPSDLSDGRRP